ncbi:MAG: hypothetical protein AB8B91_05530 [Rubripirellula sp.]
MSNVPNSKARSFVKAANRREAVAKMIKPDPILDALYEDGPNKDGKGGWINMIRDQHDQAYRLLFYLDRMQLAKAYDDQEPYAVLYGEIDPDSDTVNFPRALYTTTGAVNLMRDGIPGAQFVKMLQRGHFEIEPFEDERDILVKHLLERGCLYACVYDKEAEGLRILDLQEYSEIYFVPSRNEIQVRNEEEIVLGETNELRPFVLKLAPRRDDSDSELNRASKEADIIWNELTDK